MSSSLFNSLMGGKSGGGLGTNILLRAVGSMARGESPQEFIRNLAQTHPAFRQINPDDFENEAHRLCKERGIDEGELANQIKQYLDKM